MAFLVLKNSKLRKLFFISTAVVVLSFIMFKPLPKNITQRRKMHFLEPLMRLTYFYPIKIFGYFGFTRGQVWYTRRILSFYANLVNKVSLWRYGGIKTVDEKFDEVPVRVYIPEVLKSDGAVIFIHGGGFVLGDVASYDSLARQFSRLTGMITVSIDYRLAPEHVFPAAVVDCEKAVVSFVNDHCKKYGVDNSKIILMGDSAGGNLVAVIAQRLTNSGRKIPNPIKLQVLIYPFIQLTDLLTPSYQYARRITDGTSFLDPESIARWMLIYLGLDVSHVPGVLQNNHTSPTIRHKNAELLNHMNHQNLPQQFVDFSFYTSSQTTKTCPISSSDSCSSINDMVQYEALSVKLEPYLFNPDFSPIMASSQNFKHLPPALVLTCEFDVLRDEGYWYYNRLKNEGVEATWIHYDQGFHGMLSFHTELRLARKAMRDVAKFVRDFLAPKESATGEKYYVKT